MICTPKCTVDLRAATLRPARREDYMRRITAVGPSDMATPKWLRFLHRIFGGDQALIDFFQRVCGYCLTGIHT